jgi:PPK2 family polyphosphate:nucleotide phosphotransferase
MTKSYLLPRGAQIKLSHYDANDTGSILSKADILDDYTKLKAQLSDLQDVLFAQRRHSLLIIFQGMDCSGKDGVINKVLSGVNPQGFKVVSFKKPTEDEAAHDFLWRTHKEVPAHGFITAFNRSYYEEVLITRVHKQVDDEDARRRFKHIKHFEKLLSDNNTVVVKIFLHISKEFQIAKIKQRLSDPAKMWKFDPNDLLERNYWDEYEQAYQEVFTHCNFKESPWFLVPANKRWYRDYAVLNIVVEALKRLPLSYPEPATPIKDLIRMLPEDTKPEHLPQLTEPAANKKNGADVSARKRRV